jgi:hypothetical protein
MRISKLVPWLAVLTLALVWAVPVVAETPDAPLCLEGSSPAEPALGDPGSVPTQTTCGPCLLEFCPEVAVRCTFTGCGLNDCCRYSCVCDLSCTITNSPPNTCRFLLPQGCLCGNGVANQDEDCDGTDLRGETCVSRGFEGGTLACNSNCTFDTSGCSGTCGDGTCGGSEDCETCPEDCDSKTTGNPALRFCCGNGIEEAAEGTGCPVCDGNC